MASAMSHVVYEACALMLVAVHQLYEGSLRRQIYLSAISDLRVLHYGMRVAQRVADKIVRKILFLTTT